MSNESVVGICLSWHLARFICLVTQHCAVPFSNRFKTHMICVWHWKTNLYGMTQQYVYVYSMHCNMRLSVFFSLSFHFYCLELKIRFFFSDELILWPIFQYREEYIYIFDLCCNSIPPPILIVVTPSTKYQKGIHAMIEQYSQWHEICITHISWYR